MRYGVKYGIDVSEHNGEIDWEDVAAAGCSFAIIRSSWGDGHEDEYFRRNVHGAHDAGLECGAYHYSEAANPKTAIKEARACREIIEDTGCLLELPVFFDFEEDNWKKEQGMRYEREYMTEICREWLNHIRLNSGIYTMKYWLDHYIDWKSLGCAVWSAEWVSGWNPEPDTSEDSFGGYMWQYTDKKVIAGKQFDGDILYVPIEDN